MNEKNNVLNQQQVDAQQNAPTQPEANGSSDKVFTQADVDRTVQNRLNDALNQHQDDAQQDAPAQPETNGSSDKMFTQADVDRIVKHRLSKSKLAAADLEAREADILKREKELDAREAAFSQREKDILRKRIARDCGLPESVASRLNGNTEAEILADARQFAKDIKPPKSYPDTKANSRYSRPEGFEPHEKHRPKTIYNR